jgi:aspartate aminotransferase-like enzyme
MFYLCYNTVLYGTFSEYNQILCSIYQGLENSWANHKKCAEMLHRGVESLGLQLLVTEKVGLISIIPLYVKYYSDA